MVSSKYHGEIIEKRGVFASWQLKAGGMEGGRSNDEAAFAGAWRQIDTVQVGYSTA